MEMIRPAVFRVLAVVLALVTVVSSTAFAAAETKQSLPDAQSTQMINIAETVARFDSFVVYDRNGYRLTGIPKDATKAEIVAVREQLRSANETDARMRAIGRRNGNTYMRDGNVAILGDGGTSQIVTYWWGADFYMNHEDSQEMVYVLQTSAIYSGIAAGALLIWPGIGEIGLLGAAIVVAIMEIGALSIGYYDHGDGVIIRIMLGMPTVRSQ